MYPISLKKFIFRFATHHPPPHSLKTGIPISYSSVRPFLRQNRFLIDKWRVLSIIDKISLIDKKSKKLTFPPSLKSSGDTAVMLTERWFFPEMFIVITRCVTPAVKWSRGDDRCAERHYQQKRQNISRNLEEIFEKTKIKFWRNFLVKKMY